MRIKTILGTVLCASDRFCDYIPLISGVTNAVNLVAKAALSKKNQVSSEENIPEANQPKNSSRYGDHLRCKSVKRCLIASVPVAGNGAVLIYDIGKGASQFVKFCIKQYKNSRDPTDGGKHSQTPRPENGSEEPKNLTADTPADDPPLTGDTAANPIAADNPIPPDNPLPTGDPAPEDDPNDSIPRDNLLTADNPEDNSPPAGDPNDLLPPVAEMPSVCVATPFVWSEETLASITEEEYNLLPQDEKSELHSFLLLDSDYKLDTFLRGKSTDFALEFLIKFASHNEQALPCMTPDSINLLFSEVAYDKIVSLSEAENPARRTKLKERFADNFLAAHLASPDILPKTPS